MSFVLHYNRLESSFLFDQPTGCDETTRILANKWSIFILNGTKYLARQKRR